MRGVGRPNCGSERIPTVICRALNQTNASSDQMNDAVYSTLKHYNVSVAIEYKSIRKSTSREKKTSVGEMHCVAV